jgi:hypothetical protein
LPRSKIFNLSKIKYFFLLLSQKVFLAILAIDETTLCRIVTDLQLKGLSYNKLREHLQLIYGLDLTKHKFQVIRESAGKKARAVNQELDRNIRAKVRTIEADEVFQGMNHVILGVAEKWSQYLLDLKHATDRTGASIRTFLAPIAKKFCNIRVVITDLFKAYNRVISSLFLRARHLGCHVHTRRESMRYIDKLKATYNRMKKNRKKLVETVTKYRRKISSLVSQITNWEKKLNKDRQDRQKLLSFKQHSKSGKTKTIDHKLAALRNRVKKRSKSLQDTKRTLKKTRKLREQKYAELSTIERKLIKSHQIYLQSCRLEKDFYRLLKDQTPNFQENLQKFMMRLEKSPYTYASRLHKMIRNNSHIFSLRKKRDLAWNYQNTNTIERIFGIFRPLLDSSRLFKTAEGTGYFCDLFRLYYNTTPRYTGIHNDQSPFEQLRGKLDGRNYLDLLFPIRKRTTLFLASEISEKTSLGFRVRAYPHRGAIICT